MGTRKIRDICVFGIGGVGGYFGGKIAYRLSCDPAWQSRVSFIARGPHKDEISKRGLILNTDKEGSMVCRPALVADDASSIPPADLFLLCVKSYDLRPALAQIARNMKDDSVILPLLNGVDICERVRAVIGRGLVFPACVYIGSHIESPGVISQAGGDGVIIIGPDPGSPGVIPENVLGLFNDTGIKCRWTEHPYTAIWEKFIFISTFGLVTASTGKALDEVLSDKDLMQDALGIMHESIDIAQKKGIELPDDIEKITLEKARGFPPGTKTSFQRDVEQKGARNEGDIFGGAILRLGEQYGVPTPVTCRVYGEIMQKLSSVRD